MKRLKKQHSLVGQIVKFPNATKFWSVRFLLASNDFKNLNKLNELQTKIDLSLSLSNWKFSVNGYFSPKPPNKESVAKCGPNKKQQVVNCNKKVNQKQIIIYQQLNFKFRTIIFAYYENFEMRILILLNYILIMLPKCCY